jgi:hypothetical protein
MANTKTAMPRKPATVTKSVKFINVRPPDRAAQ